MSTTDYDAVETISRLATAALILTVAACSRDSREADIKACVAKAQQQTSHGQLPYRVPANASAEDLHDAMGSLVIDCMENQGYRHDGGALANARCIDDIDYNPFCFRR